MRKSKTFTNIVFTDSSKFHLEEIHSQFAPQLCKLELTVFVIYLEHFSKIKVMLSEQLRQPLKTIKTILRKTAPLLFIRSFFI